jgi:DNA (cytosine-5)-methyltransferase 1
MAITAIDSFCGAGGSTTGLKAAGIEVIHAANHWARAIESHNTNHPDVDHSCVDLHMEHPSRFPKADIGWFSPSCTTHSPAGGRKRKHPGQLDLLNPKAPDPSVERSRMGAWDVVNFTEFHRYQVVIVENVLEFTEWELFGHWIKAMRALGYIHQICCFNSQFAGVPQSRDRVYVVFHRKGNRKPIVDFKPLGQCPEHGEVRAVQAWKQQSLRSRIGKYRTQYIYACPHCAAEVVPQQVPASSAIDWAIPCPRIGDRVRPLSEATLRRVEKGLRRFAVQPRPLIDTLRNHAIPRPVDEPTTTVTAQGNHHALIAPPFLAAYHGGRDSTRSLDEPAYTVATSNQAALIKPFLSSYYGNGGESSIDSPAPTMRTVQGHALVEPDWTAAVEDCGYRMISAGEAKRLMGFASDYVLLGNQSEQFKQAGNAVTPPVAELLGRAAIASLAS